MFVLSYTKNNSLSMLCSNKELFSRMLVDKIPYIN